jgi:hypothetical protein
MSSQAVQALSGGGELEVLAGAGHLLVEAAEHLRARLRAWIADAFNRPIDSVETGVSGG